MGVRRRYVAPMPSFENVGEVIHVLRIVRGLSQGDLADLSGVRNSSISNYERGKSVPKLETLRKLADGLELSLSDMEETERFIRRMRQRKEASGESASGVTALTSPLEDLEGQRSEIDRLSAEAGRLVTRLTRVGLEMLASGTRARAGEPEPGASPVEGATREGAGSEDASSENPGGGEAS